MSSNTRYVGDVVRSTRGGPRTILTIASHLTVNTLRCLERGKFSIPNSMTVTKVNKSRLSGCVAPNLAAVSFSFRSTNQRTTLLVLRGIGKRCKRRVAEGVECELMRERDVW